MTDEESNTAVELAAIVASTIDVANDTHVLMFHEYKSVRRSAQGTIEAVAREDLQA